MQLINYLRYSTEIAVYVEKVRGRPIVTMYNVTDTRSITSSDLEMRDTRSPIFLEDRRYCKDNNSKQVIS